jgi:isocitrate/isopropylmalate dehydrogenase
MLRTLGHAEAASSIERAVEDVLREGRHKTADIGGTASTSIVGDAVVASLKKAP